MSNTAFNHYKNFLSQVYSWSLGDKNELFQRNKQWLKDNGITQGTLLDLGAGFGSHAIPAVEIGLKVTAVDFSTELLSELKAYNNQVEIIDQELLSYLKSEARKFDTILCLGDTLTHLESISAVKDFVHEVSKRLSPEGRLFLSWRDYASIPLTDENRFIQVKQDPQYLMTCILENVDHELIKVTDVIHHQGKVSGHSYFKLKLTPKLVQELLLDESLKTDSHQSQGRLSSLSTSLK